MQIETVLPRFGLSEFRPGQREVIEAVLAGRPTIAVLPTGAGKSLCYQLPAVALGGLTVVVSPLISLMKDQVDALVARNIPAAFINSSVDPEEREATLARAVRGELRLLYVAPERFRVGGFAAELKRAALTLVAVDEAHCISEWGHDFRPDYARLGEVLRALAPPRVVALTATATATVRTEICERLGLIDPAVFVRGFDRPNLRFMVVASGGDADKLPRCLQLLGSDEAREKPAIIYTATRKKAEKVAEALRARRITARAYHAGLDDEARSRVQDEWQAGAVRVVVATNAFGMGVDKGDVRLVIHHDLPGSPEAYYQEAGRAGRDGQPARCVLLFNHADVRLREFLISAPGESGEKPQALQAAERDRLRAIMSYAYARRCRRAFLLGYFGDPEAGRACGGCDVCEDLGPGAATPLDEEQILIVRKALATVARLDGWFGRHRVALVLEGSTAKEVSASRFEQLATFGMLRGRAHAWVLDFLGALEAAGLIAPEGDEYPTLRLTAAGREVMHARQPPQVSWPQKRARSRREETRGAKDPERATPIDSPLFERLRGLRAKLAAEERLPAYCVFHDRTLAELCRARPASLDALSQIPGVGPNKLAKYGQKFLAAIAEE
ncbi:MAG TPA: ATP-dependent DNA helicase RecQ [Polyangia bacterium]